MIVREKTKNLKIFITKILDGNKSVFEDIAQQFHSSAKPDRIQKVFYKLFSAPCTAETTSCPSAMKTRAKSSSQTINREFFPVKMTTKAKSSSQMKNEACSTNAQSSSQMVNKESYSLQTTAIINSPSRMIAKTHSASHKTNSRIVSFLAFICCLIKQYHSCIDAGHITNKQSKLLNEAVSQTIDLLQDHLPVDFAVSNHQTVQSQI